MCGRFAATGAEADLVEEFEVRRVVDRLPAPRHNIAPTDPVAVITRRDGERVASTMHWGLVPPWAKDRSGAARLINARAETVVEKPSFRRAARSRRCLVPADGYFEWTSGGGPAPSRSGKQAWFLHPAGGRIAMAGLHEVWRDHRVADGEPGAWLATVTVITTRASDALGHVHDRMPVRIAPDLADDWLDPGLDTADDARALLAAAVATGAPLDVRAVGPDVGRVGTDGPQLVAPVE